MYIDGNTIKDAAEVISAILVILGVIGSLVKVYTNLRKQIEIMQQMQTEQATQMQAMRDEQRVLCKGLKGALEGLIEQGCNGPCHNALEELENHLNDSAHE